MVMELVVKGKVLVVVLARLKGQVVVHISLSDAGRSVKHYQKLSATNCRYIRVYDCVFEGL